ncbi:glutamate-cysteine ligase family protein [uncultured Dubosiella sp.]|uniref:glutamate-cysteine ligase family protein n=1 Tax=uncultured Dubosiella sp. TaxID=1937011 RepID=UPI0025B52B63|nr:glutamate-cysteine ligase family protein [uncultured Dubosiella sp.]
MTPLIEYFQKGASKDSRALGVEIEHFVLNETTGKPMPYDEIAQLLEFLEPIYDKAYYEEGRLIALESKTTLITLEPGCQLELSFRYTPSLDQIRDWYEEAMEPIFAFVNERGYRIAYSGGLPTIPVADVPRILKKRYELMEKWFETTGTRGREMMKGTAAVHVSIDYGDETDFVKKYAMANYLHLMLSFLTSNTPMYEGKPNADVFLRDSIWEHTDSRRSGYMPKALDADFGFAAYADWVEQMPLVVMNDGVRITDAGQRTCMQVAETYGWDETVIAHYLSMVFPFVRLKRFIEIRSADCMPLAWTLSYCALIKGLFYDEDNVAFYSGKASACTIDTLHAYKRCIERDQWDAKVYGDTLAGALGVLLKRAARGLDAKERAYLTRFERLVAERRHIFEESGENDG